jgi:hypothetical protein
LYADDTQLYIPFDIGCNEDLLSSLKRIEDYIMEIKLWMAANKLMLTSEKTEIMIITAKLCKQNF